MITTTMSVMNPVRLKLMICMVCLVLQVVYGEHEMMCIQSEREALLQFKAALFDRYGRLSSWNNTSDCCQWKGIRCSNLTRHILMLDLHGEINYKYDIHGDTEISSQRHISGEIHKSLTELRQLKYLNLSRNFFSFKEIPEFLGSLSNLRYLDLSSCDFGGKIPTQFGSLSHLKYLNLARNSLDGVIPRQLGNLSNLHHLDLSINYIEGNIPSQLGSLSRLQYLDLNGNSFKGKIPSQLGNLSRLQYLDLGGNSFKRKIPSQLGNLFRLQYLDLFGNSFKGNIPSQLGNLSNLQELFLGGYDSAFKIDDVDQWISNLISLTNLYLVSISNLNSSHSWLEMIGKLPKIRQLSLVECNLSDHFILSSSSYKFNSSTSLSILDLSSNTLMSSMIFQWVSNITSNLVQLDLRGNLLEGSTSNHVGVVLNSLEHLDLSSNKFKGEVLKSFMNICTLHSLNLHENNLTEDLPSILHNLSSGCVSHSLQQLDLSYNQITGSLPELSVFSSLKTLFLDGNQLSGKIPEGIRLPSKLESLSIRSNSLEGGVPKSFGRACSLELLDLYDNKLSEELTVILNHLSECSRYSLRELSLSSNKIDGILPNFSMFLKLEILDLSGNQLKEIGVPKSFQNATILRSLYLSNNSLSENLPMIIHRLSRYAGFSLQKLDLSMNQISGTLPNLLSMFPSLKILHLDQNKLNGTISEDVRFPTELEELYLSSNSLKGVITDYHFTNMSKLNTLMLSDNSLTLRFKQNWVPPFQLDHIDLRSCELGPTFPKWLKTQNAFSYLDISNAGISDTVPKWFWSKLALDEQNIVDISCNNLQGVIPNFPLKNQYYSSLHLGSNQFEGSVPPFLRGHTILDLSKNKFSESVSFLCNDEAVETLYQLDLSNNQLSGQIPDCWSHFKSLAYLNLSHNKFSGKIPASMGSLLELQVLSMRNNNLTDEVPSSLRNCSKLVMLDMTENRLSGPIPAWIGSELQELQVLSLGGNHFYGSLPLQICYLQSIQLLDLSLNNLFGRIPKCIKNFTSMAQKTLSRYFEDHYIVVNTTGYKISYSYGLNAFLMWKGSEQMFMDNGLSLLKSIDLSSNHFSEEIPREIENLFGLVSLNLSGNNLTGKIPSNIGNLTSLEFLDLSRNQLVGSIPSSLTEIDRLTMLDVSHNHLSGMIPTGTQLQSFNASSYEDNDLCGPPLKKLCTDGEPAQEPIDKLHEDDNSLFTREFYMSMAIGFVISFWGVFGSILLKRSWRHAYFKFLSNSADIIYVMAAVKVFKWRHIR